MPGLPGEPGSIWLDGPAPAFGPPLEGDARADVAVVGAGIVGAAAALFLAERGASVVLVEARSVAGAVTGHSTAKATALHESSYSTIADRVGREAAAAFAAVNLEGVELVGRLADEHGIECSLERAPNLLYAEDEEGAARVETEFEAARAAGVPAELGDDAGLPFPVRAAARLDDQIAFDSAAFTRGLVAAARAAGAAIHEHSRLRSLRHRDRCTLTLENGATLSADRVVLATQMPVLDRGLYFARLRPQASYAIAGPVDHSPPGMYLGVGSATRSIRSLPGADGTRRLIVGGEGHKVGQGDAAGAYRRLAAWAGERFGLDVATHRWSAHDLMSPDGLPMVGRLAPWAPRILCATGFGKWGLAQGVAAADMLAAELSGAGDARLEAYDPLRLNPGGQALAVLKENADVAFRFVADRVGQAGNPRCSHLGCLVRWNEADETWDCPCHGSRFAADGSVLNGPAAAPLELGED